MELPRGLEEMIDEYVADALDTTGTRKARPKPRAKTPLPIATVAATPAPATADDIDDDVLIPIEIELEPATDPDAVHFFVPSDDRTDNEIFLQLSQQLAHGESAVPSALPRHRAARGSGAPLPAVVLEADDDEPTNVVGKPIV